MFNLDLDLYDLINRNINLNVPINLDKLKATDVSVWKGCHFSTQIIMSPITLYLLEPIAGKLGMFDWDWDQGIGHAGCLPKPAKTRQPVTSLLHSACQLKNLPFCLNMFGEVCLCLWLDLLWDWVIKLKTFSLCPNAHLFGEQLQKVS